MTVTIAYDRPVKNMIDQLDATGHVSHVQHRKTHVTLHHNGARLSHEGVLGVWQTRPASAQFDIDILGDLAQYVRVMEYAWATGNTAGNEKSISIEMCNLTLGPDWQVGEATWRSAARLAGWLFARVIGYRPTREFLVMHSYWNATVCAGPFVLSMYDRILSDAQFWYDVFTGALQPTPETETELDMSGFTGYAMQVVSDPVVPGKPNADQKENIALGTAWLFDQVNVTVDYFEGPGGPASLKTACDTYKIPHMGVTGRYVLNRINEARAHAKRLEEQQNS